MEKIYEKSYEGENLYATLCTMQGQGFIRCFWVDCVLSMEEIIKSRRKGNEKFIVVFRCTGAELFPQKEGITSRFSFYKREEPESRLFLLDYVSESVYSISWEEAEAFLETK